MVRQNLDYHRKIDLGNKTKKQNNKIIIPEPLSLYLTFPMQHQELQMTFSFSVLVFRKAFALVSKVFLLFRFKTVFFLYQCQEKQCSQVCPSFPFSLSQSHQ